MYRMSRTPYRGGSTGLPTNVGTCEATFRTSPHPTELSNWLDYFVVHLL